MRKFLCAVALVLSSLAMTSPAPVAAVTFCSGIQCFQDADCWTYCPGGVGASYCNRAQHKCIPY
jgi:hypothetical protein